MTALVCGSRSSAAKVAPPLKSTSTKLRISGQCVTASASTSVRSSSLLPEPVAPTSRPCGPMPSCADSLRSSSTGRPSALTPIGTRSRSRFGRLAQPRSRSSVVRVAEAEQVGQAGVAGGRLVGVATSADSRSGASSRASDSASAPRQRVGPPDLRGAVHRGAGDGAVGGDVEHHRGVVEQARRRVGQVDQRDAVDAAVGHQVVGAGRRAAVDQRRPGAGRRRWTAATSNRGRPASTSSSIASSDGDRRRRTAGPGRPRRSSSGARACGSHFAHSQPGRARHPTTHRPISRSSGAWKVASWASSARTRPRPASPRRARRPG